MKYFQLFLLLNTFIFTSCSLDSNRNENNQQDYTSEHQLSNYDQEPYFKYSWHLQYLDNSFSQTFGIDKNANINVTQAWKSTYGMGVKVAVIDDAFEPTHEDIRENVLVFYNFDDDNTDVTNHTDKETHGHSCAGLIASPINSKGIIGVAPQSKLILIKQFEDNDAKTIQAFEYAKKQGAKVISCSWGTYQVSQAVEEEIKDIHDSGITIIFAFGNDNYNLDKNFVNDESELPSVIGIGSSNEFNKKATYSSYGSNIDLLAPAGDNLGVVTVDESGKRGYNPDPQGIVDYSRYLNNNYTFFSGTSASAPITAGVVALMVSVNQSLSPDDIRTILIKTADKIGSHYDSNGFSIYKGYGKVNALKAVEMAKTFKH